MTKRLILAFVFLSWHLAACSNGDSGISSGLPDRRCVKMRTFFFYAQSPYFHKLGLCYYLKNLYL